MINQNLEPLGLEIREETDQVLGGKRVALVSLVLLLHPTRKHKKEGGRGEGSKANGCEETNASFRIDCAGLFFDEVTGPLTAVLRSLSRDT